MDVSLLSQLTSGWLQMKQEEHGVTFSRFTPRQEALNAQRGFGVKNAADAGMSLDFFASPGTVTLTYSVLPGSSRSWYGIDVLINGVLQKSVFENALPERAELTVNVTGKGEQRVRIVLPSLAGLRILDFTSTMPLRPVIGRKKLFIAGDSITQGYDAFHPSLAYTALLAEMMDAECLNQAIGGDVFFADNLGSDIGFAPDLCLIAYGVNDWGRNLDTFADARAYFERLTALFPKAPVAAILPIRRLDAEGETQKRNGRGLTMDDQRALIARAAEAYGVFVINGRDFIPPLPEYYSDGHLHPGDPGFAFYFSGVKEALKNASLL